MAFSATDRSTTTSAQLKTAMDAAAVAAMAPVTKARMVETKLVITAPTAMTEATIMMDANADIVPRRQRIRWSPLRAQRRGRCNSIETSPL